MNFNSRPGSAGLYFADDPLRPPYWRFIRVQALRAKKGKRRLCKYDDQLVRDYCTLLDGLQNAKSYAAVGRLREKYTALYQAHLAFFESSGEFRHLLEAYLLTGEPLEETAKRFALTEEAVQTYGELFFDVQSRLNVPGFIATVVMGTWEERHAFDGGSKRVLSAEQLALVYRLVGYYAGPLALELVYTGFAKTQTLPRNPEAVQEWLDQAIKTSIRTKAVAASRLLSVHDFNIMEVIDKGLQLAESASNAGDLDTCVSHLKAYFEESPYCLGKYNMQDNLDQVELDMMQGEAEPRVMEIQEALQTGKVPEVISEHEPINIASAK